MEDAVLLNSIVRTETESLRSKMMTSQWLRLDESQQFSPSQIQVMTRTFKAHWPEYLMEASGLGFFMISACAFGVLLFHPLSPVTQSIANSDARRVLMGIAMGLTNITIIFSPFGKRSGAHINPAVTLTYFWLGKIESWDAAFYALFQFMGGIIGILTSSVFLGTLVAHQSVNYVVTVPGPAGPGIACLAEVVISFILMSVILRVSNTKALSRWTGVFAGALVATYISLEAPISGMSMNPARTLSSAVGAQLWTSLWIYFVAPALGMLLAALIHKHLSGAGGVMCAKLHHHNNQRCIFRCSFQK